jgi:hypothetical protein
MIDPSKILRKKRVVNSGKPQFNFTGNQENLLCNELFRDEPSLSYFNQKHYQGNSNNKKSIATWTYLNHQAGSYIISNLLRQIRPSPVKSLGLEN